MSKEINERAGIVSNRSIVVIELVDLVRKNEYDLLGRGSYTNTGYCPETSRDANGYNRN